LSITDLPIRDTQKLSKHLYNIVSEKFKKHDSKEKRIESLHKYIQRLQGKLPSNSCVYMNIEVGYEEKENIGLFTDYLMDLDDNVQSFYFRFEYMHNTKLLLQN